MRINESKLEIPRNWTKIYECENYRRYDRIKYLTSKDTKLGRLGVMISIRRSDIILHAFVDGLYLKYPKRFSDYGEAGKAMKYITTQWYKFYVTRLLKYQTEDIIPFEYFRIIDKIMSITSLKKRNRSRLMQHYILSEHRESKYVIFDCINMLVNRDKDITDIVEPFLSHTSTWIRKLPYDELWKERFDLPSMTIGSASNTKLIKKMSFEKFENMIKDWTTDEVTEVIGRYKIMTPRDYAKDPRKVLYQILLRRESKWKKQ